MSAQRDGDGTSAARTIWKLESSICDAPQYSPSIFQLQRRGWFFIFLFFFLLFPRLCRLAPGSRWNRSLQRASGHVWNEAAEVPWKKNQKKNPFFFFFLFLSRTTKRKESGVKLHLVSLFFSSPSSANRIIPAYHQSHSTQDEVANCSDTNMTAKIQARRRLNEKYIYFCEGDLVSVPLSGRLWAFSSLPILQFDLQSDREIRLAGFRRRRLFKARLLPPSSSWRGSVVISHHCQTERENRFSKTRVRLSERLRSAVCAAAPFKTDVGI